MNSLSKILQEKSITQILVAYRLYGLGTAFLWLPYFFHYVMECFSFQNSQDGSRFLGLFMKGKTHTITKFDGTDLVICSHSQGLS